MRNDAGSPVQDSLKALLQKEGIERVAIVDDAFDSIAEGSLTAEEVSNLWALLEFDEEFHEQLDRMSISVNSTDDLTGALIDELLKSGSEVPRFEELWSQSVAGVRKAEALAPVTALREQLKEIFALDVQTFGSGVETTTLVDIGPQLVFLDWFLGDDRVQTAEEAIANTETHPAVLAAASKAQEILESWPGERPKPLIVLMSSKRGVEANAGAFCRQAKILRGMFYAVSKATLSDPFTLRLNLNLYAMSLPTGRRLQSFMDALRNEFETARTRFLDTLSDLSLTDYASIQRLSLQKEGQPLGDYLLWLFSTFLGQMLFGEGLKGVGNDLDRMTFEEALASAGPPSDTLTTIYHTALFDTSVGPVMGHPLAEGNGGVPEQVHPAIALGDVLRRQDAADDTEEGNGAATSDSNDPEDESQPAPCVDGEGADRSDGKQEDSTSEHAIRGKSVPELLLLINAQCDLAYRPTSEPERGSMNDLAILLLPGSLHSVGTKGSRASQPKTELYQQDGKNYRIEWDLKNVQAVPLAEFLQWMKKERYERSARLRLPLALEIQRAFATDVARIGSPVSPPIYQPISVQLLQPNSQSNAYETVGDLEEGEAAFLVLTRSGQQCVFTLPLLAKVKKLLEARRVTLGEDVWSTLQSPFKPPTLGNPLPYSNGRFRIERGAREGQQCNTSIAMTIGIHIDDTDDPEELR